MKDAEEYINLSNTTPNDFEFDRFVRVWVESRKPEIAEELWSRYQHLADDIYRTSKQKVGDDSLKMDQTSHFKECICATHRTQPTTHTNALTGGDRPNCPT